MRFKEGVYIRGAEPELLVAMMVVEGCYQEFDRHLTVTSVVDGTHSRMSEHYRGAAMDCRTLDPVTRQPLADLDALTAKIRGSLPEDFDVVLESDHIHVEFDPKGKMP